MIMIIRRSEDSFERISVFDIEEQIGEHGIHCLPCFKTKDIMHLLP